MTAGTPTGGARRAILRTVHPQTPPPEIVAVELTNGVGCFRVGSVFGEGKSARAAGLAIGSDVNAGDSSRLRQQRRELFLGRVEAQITDENLVRNVRLLIGLPVTTYGASGLV